MKNLKYKGRIPCFLCGIELEVRHSKRDKPYLICDPCGVQIFIRREKGIDLLKGLLNFLSQKETALYGLGVGVPRLFVLINQLEVLEEKRKNIESKVSVLDWLDPKNGSSEAIQVLEREIQKIRKALTNLSST